MPTFSSHTTSSVSSLRGFDSSLAELLWSSLYLRWVFGGAGIAALWLWCWVGVALAALVALPGMVDPL